MEKDNSKREVFSHKSVYEFLNFFGVSLSSSLPTIEARKALVENLSQDLELYLKRHHKWSSDLKDEIRELSELQGKLLISPDHFDSTQGASH